MALDTEEPLSSYPSSLSRRSPAIFDREPGADNYYQKFCYRGQQPAAAASWLARDDRQTHY